MKSSDKSKMWEAIPTRVVLQAGPIASNEEIEALSKGNAGARGFDTLKICGVTTQPTTLNKAIRQAGKMLRHCRHRVMHCRDPLAVLDLIQINPEFIAVPWVRETLFRVLQSKRNLGRRGRSKGTFKVNPMMIHALVQQCLDLGIAESKERAFGEISLWEGLPSYDEMKRLYYQTEREDRFRAVVVQFPELAKLLTEEEVAAQLNDAKTLCRGQSITETLVETGQGPFTITFKG